MKKGDRVQRFFTVVLIVFAAAFGGFGILAAKAQGPDLYRGGNAGAGFYNAQKPYISILGGAYTLKGQESGQPWQSQPGSTGFLLISGVHSLLPFVEGELVFGSHQGAVWKQPFSIGGNLLINLVMLPTHRFYLLGGLTGLWGRLKYVPTEGTKFFMSYGWGCGYVWLVDRTIGIEGRFVYHPTWFEQDILSADAGPKRSYRLTGREFFIGLRYNY